MRKALTILAAVPALIVAAGAQAGTLPSFTVPTFSVSYIDYDPEDYSGDVDYPAAAHVVSTNPTATVISLDSHV